MWKSRLPATETPPRTWRRPLTGEDDVTLLGNTSTDVEKTRKRGTKRERGRKHLHGRGEDAPAHYGDREPEETPPRTWRRLLVPRGVQSHLGNTSTDVEKTKTPDRARLSLQKHLHGRGEDCCRLFSDADRQGNTSTDVEKTSSRPEVRMPTWKHLHGRGEDSVRAYIVMTAGETPPRTWRRLARFLHTVTARRNTSTDVEKTSAGDTGLWHFEKHLHGRGEDPVVAPTSKLPRETPPRTWRRQPDALRVRPATGNTSTDVEKTRNEPRASAGL